MSPSVNPLRTVSILSLKSPVCSVTPPPTSPGVSSLSDGGCSRPPRVGSAFARFTVCRLTMKSVEAVLPGHTPVPPQSFSSRASHPRVSGHWSIIILWESRAWPGPVGPVLFPVSSSPSQLSSAPPGPHLPSPALSHPVRRHLDTQPTCLSPDHVRVSGSLHLSSLFRFQPAETAFHLARAF